MIILIVSLFLLSILFGVAYRLTGALLAAVIWLGIKLPLAIMFFALGVVFCITLILIPIGIGCFKIGIRLLIPGI